MKIPSLEQAQSMLQEAEALNPGPWVQHSIFAAKAAQAIANHLPDLDGQTAYILGLLHNIGRRYGVTAMRHVLDGYTYLVDLGYEDAARICLTHSFPIQNTQMSPGHWDCSDQEMQRIDQLLGSIRYNDYDRLIQMCDGLAMSTGFCLMEKRFIEVAMRHGMNNRYKDIWQAHLATRDAFEQIIGCSVYNLLPGVVENTFGFDFS